MSEFTVQYLGCGSATPSLRHMPSCQIVDYRNSLMMVDCGEGAQLTMRRMRIHFARLRHIFISHLHGDHFLGLPGLLSTLSLQDKGGNLHVHVFEQGEELLRHFMRVTTGEPTFEIIYDRLYDDEPRIVLDTKALAVTSFPLHHRVPCVGFRFDEKPKARHLRGDMAAYLGIPVCDIPAIKEGADWTTPDGRTIDNERLTLPPSPSYSYAYCSDTSYHRDTVEAVHGVNVLYHEATYADDKKSCARLHGHSTARQAAMVAREAEVGCLVLGHYSKSYCNEDSLLAEAREIFPNTIAATEGMRMDIEETVQTQDTQA